MNQDWKATAAGLARGSAGHGVVLVSAFDLASPAKENATRDRSPRKTKGTAAPGKKPPTRIAGFRGVVLDSGGYEARKFRVRWSRRQFETVADRFRADIVVGFDPLGEADYKSQIKGQVGFLGTRAKGTLRTLLLHLDLARTDLSEFVRFLLPHAKNFDILGLTEKDLGPSFPDRIRCLSGLRHELDASGLVCPIHLFGTDDPLSLVIYAAAGVDIFDGLGWATEFMSPDTMSRHDLGHAPMSDRWRAFAASHGQPEAHGAAVLGLAFEWNLRELANLMAEVRRGILHGEEGVLVELCRRSTFKTDDILEDLRRGR